MIRHYYTLLRLAKSFQNLIGFRVTECFTQEKDTVTIELSDGSNTETLHFSADPKFCSIYLRYNFSRAGKNTTDLMPELLGDYLQDITVKDNDRVLIFEFVSITLYVMLYGGSESNLVLTSKQNDTIIDALNRRKAPIGEKLIPKQANNKNYRQFADDSKLRDVFAKSSLLLGKDYAEEFMFRNNIDINSIKSHFKESELQSLISQANAFKEELLSSEEYYLYRRENDSIIFSMIELSKYPVAEKQSDNIHKAIQMRLSYEHKEDTYAKDYKDAEKRLDSKVLKLRRNIGFASDFSKTEEKIEKYTLWGEVLLSQPNAKDRPGKSIILNDWSGNEVKIPLDDKFDMMQNAHIFYEKAKKAKQELAVRKLRIPKLQEELNILNEIKKEIESVDNIKDLNKFVNRHQKILGIKKQGNKTLDASDKYKTFDLGDGFTLFVGKNAANNDELTMRFAKANDLWFHVRGISGSHAVIRIEKGQKPGKHIIEKAASITAYYSKMRNAGLTPVAYTEKKYVRKPKGANPGQVLISKEKVVQVVPGLPEGYTE